MVQWWSTCLARMRLWLQSPALENQQTTKPEQNSSQVYSNSGFRGVGSGWDIPHYSRQGQRYPIMPSVNSEAICSTGQTER